MKKDNKIYTILFTFLVTFGFVVLLSFANEVTKAKSAQNQKLFLVRAVLHAMDLSFYTDQQALSIYDKEITVQQREGFTVFGYEPSADQIAETLVSARVGILFSGNGLWSLLRGVIAFDKSLTQVTGIDFIEQNETPGLGGRIEEPWFKEQFRGEVLKNGSLAFRTNPSSAGDSNKLNGSVDAITGATSTSKALQRILNSAIINLKKALGE